MTENATAAKVPDVAHQGVILVVSGTVVELQMEHVRKLPLCRVPLMQHMIDGAADDVFLGQSLPSLEEKAIGCQAVHNDPQQLQLHLDIECIVVGRDPSEKMSSPAGKSAKRENWLCTNTSRGDVWYLL